MLQTQTLQSREVEWNLATAEVEVEEDVVAVVVANRVHPLEAVVRLAPLVATVEEFAFEFVRNDQLLQFDVIHEPLPPLRDLEWRKEGRN